MTHRIEFQRHQNFNAMNKSNVILSYVNTNGETIEVKYHPIVNKPMFHHSDIHMEGSHEIYTPTSLDRFVLSIDEAQFLVKAYIFFE